jgi:saccharopine dehydrogenase-like NADP-dependent oxidoreductase
MPSRKGRIIVIGGYGQVGQAVSRSLAPTFPGRVVVAGRSQSRAESFAAMLGHGARGLRFDVDAEDAGALLAEAATVVMCLDPRGTGFVERCLQAGVDYVDVTAKQESLDAFERLDAVARAAGSTAVLSVGVAPGMTNLLGAWAVSGMETVERLDLFVLTGAADVHGAAALEWTLDNLAVDFDVYRDGRLHRVHGFRERTDVRFPDEARARGAWRLNFPDQRTVARTLSLPTVSTWLRFEPPLLTSLVALAVRLGAARWLRVPRVRAALIGLANRVQAGSEVCAVLARAEGLLPGGRRGVREAAFKGRQEAVLTGEVAAEVARDLLTGNRPGGVLHLERYTEPEGLLRRIAERSPGARLWAPSEAG